MYMYVYMWKGELCMECWFVFIHCVYGILDSMHIKRGDFDDSISYFRIYRVILYCTYSGGHPGFAHVRIYGQVLDMTIKSDEIEVIWL